MRKFLVLGLLVACGPQAPYSDVEQSALSKTYAEVVCDQVFDCDCPLEEWLDKTTCINQLESLVGEGQTRAQQADASYDPECVAERLNVSLTNQCLERDEPRKTCLIFHGSRSEGMPCDIFDVHNRMSNCEQGLYCNAVNSICEDPDKELLPQLGEGDACLTEDGEPYGNCDPFEGLFCDSSLAIPECRPRPGEGEPCSTASEVFRPCRVGNICAASGQCKALARLGESCSYSLECESARCEANTCVETFRLPGGCSGYFL